MMLKIRANKYQIIIFEQIKTLFLNNFESKFNYNTIQFIQPSTWLNYNPYRTLF